MAKQPSRDSCAIRKPFLSVRTGEPRLLTENDTEMEGEGNGARIKPESTGWEDESPTSQYNDDGDVHGIPSYLVQADTHQPLGGRPRSQTTATGHIEIPNAP